MLIGYVSRFKRVLSLILLAGSMLPIGAVTAAMLDTPALESPINQQKISPNDVVEYQWKAGDQASQYDFRLYDPYRKLELVRLRLEADAVCSDGMCTYTPPESATLTNYGRYRWFVRAINASQRSKWARHRINVSGVAPDKPQIMLPYNNVAYESSEALTFEWTAVEDAERYIFRLVNKNPLKVIYRRALLKDEVHCKDGVCRYQLDEEFELTPGDYRWTVASSNGYNKSRHARSRITIISPIPRAAVSDGYDWQLPEYAVENTRGGLVRDRWKAGEYANSVFYSLRWDEVPLDAEGNYNFGGFNWWLNQSSDGKDSNVVVRLEVNSRCETPAEFHDEFKYYRRSN